MGQSSMEKDTFRRIVNLDRVCQNNIVVENFGSDNSSVFRQEYAQAANIIDSILRLNKEKKEKKNEALHVKAEYQTVVPFIGERGTGKTSAMCSVLQALKTSPETFLPSLKETNDVGFICMDMIDINSMKPNENLMEIVLAQMLAYMQNQEKNLRFQEPFSLEKWRSRQREIYTQIDTLSRAFSRLHWHKNFDPEEQGIVGIQKIAETKNAIKRFHQLVCDFTDACKSLQSGKSSCYLVLTFDDIDMFRGSNQREESSQFAILEQIYDYLRIPNMIVLLTFNEQILQRNCMSHYCNAYFKRNFTQECTMDEQNEITTLTKQFLSKLFPHEQRIYMPNFLFANTNNTPNLYIIPLKNGEETPFPPFVDKSDFKDATAGSRIPRAISVKEFTLRLIAYKTGVYFDINGTKKHFLESRNLRELGTMLQTIFQWPDPYKSDSPESMKALNRDRFLNYMHNQFAGEHLRPEEYQRFQNLSALPLVRQGRTLVDDTCRYRMISVKNPAEFGYLGATSRDRWKYSYGELTHSIYYATRVQNNGVTLYSKPYIHCILGSQSIILNQMLYEEDRRHILEFVGSSIGGRWSNEMLPKFKRVGLTSQTCAAGSCSAPTSVFLNLRLPDDLQEMLRSVEKMTKERILQFAEALALVGMFFTGYPAAGLKAKLDVDPEDDNLVFYLKSTSEDHICFNVLNPFLNFYAVTDIGDQSVQKDYLSYIFGKLNSLTKNFPSALICSLKEKSNDGKSAEGNLDQLYSEMKSPRTDPEKQRLYASLKRLVSSGKKAELLLEKISEKTLKNFEKAWKYVMNQLVISENTYTSIDFTKKSVVFSSVNQNLDITLPVQHLDMMYNILKRVSTVSYRDIPEEADVSEAYDYCVRLYKNIDQELAAQDAGYGSNSPGLADKFHSSFFYQIFTETEQDYHNPYLRELFNAVVQNILQYAVPLEVSTRIAQND